jgi:N utilization substance protein B
MAVTQQKFREILFQAIYSREFSSNESQDMIEFLMAEHEVTKKTIYQVQTKMGEILLKQPEIDVLIRNESHAYEFERISSVEKNILRLGLFEMSYDCTIPPKVAISESIRLARKFGTPESANFVNAIMDAVYKKQSIGPTIDLTNV